MELWDSLLSASADDLSYTFVMDTFVIGTYMFFDYFHVKCFF
jgi:hypothetical protein